METRTTFLVGVLFCVACAVVSTSAHKMSKEHMEKMKKCGDGEINVEEAFKGKKECFEQFKPKKTDEEERRRRRSPDEDGEGKKKWGKKWGKFNMCAVVCEWKKKGVLDESGKFSESGTQAHVNLVYPESKRTEAYNKMKECADTHSASFSMDENCKGYGKFKKCVWKGHMQVCDIKWEHHGKGKGEGKKSDDEE